MGFRHHQTYGSLSPTFAHFRPPQAPPSPTTWPTIARHRPPSPTTSPTFAYFRPPQATPSPSPSPAIARHCPPRRPPLPTTTLTVARHRPPHRPLAPAIAHYRPPQHPLSPAITHHRPPQCPLSPVIPHRPPQPLPLPTGCPLSDPAPTIGHYNTYFYLGIGRGDSGGVDEAHVGFVILVCSEFKLQLYKCPKDRVPECGPLGCHTASAGFEAVESMLCSNASYYSRIV